MIIIYCIVVFIIVLIAKKPSNALKNQANINILNNDFKVLEGKKQALKDKLELIEIQIDTLDHLLIVINEQLNYTVNDNKKTVLLNKKISVVGKLEKLQDKHNKIINELDNLV